MVAQRLTRQPRATGAVSLRHRVAFDKRVAPAGGTDYGQAQGAFAAQFEVAAAIEARFGGEAVTAARLASRQPFTVTVRQSADTRLIDTTWRARKVRGATTLATYDIRSIADPDDSRRYFDILVEARGEE